MLSKEIIKIKYNISLNHYLASILKKEIEFLDRTRKKYLTRLKDIVITKKYKSHCFCCDEYIDSEVDEFCVVCGWFKCSWLERCGCDYTPPRVNKRYKNILLNNNEAKILKEKIEEINVNRSLSNEQCNKMKNDNDFYNKKLNQFVKLGVKDEI